MISWVSTLLLFYFFNLIGRSYYRPYLVYCTHWTYSIELQAYIRDLIIPTGNFLISMSILYMYYHQTLLLRTMQKKVVASKVEENDELRLMSDGKDG